MRVFHISDTHLGFAAYAKADPDRAINQREADFYDSFERFVDVAERERPDAILHTGDLFDAVRPSNRAISFAMDQFKRISDAGIPLIAISGNHETPRIRETGSVFGILDRFENFALSYESSAKSVVLEGVEFVCIPHSTEEGFKEAFDGLKKQGNIDKVALMHIGVVGIDIFRTNEVNELILDASDISDDLRYVALGHYHNYARVKGNCCYAGSTERSSIAEAGVEKGFIDIDLDSKKRKFVRLPTRRMLDLPPINCRRMTPQEIKKSILELLEQNEIDGAIIRITLNDVPKEARLGLDMNAIRKAGQNALHLEAKISEVGGAETIQSESARIGSLEEEFRRFVARANTNKLDKGRLEKMGLRIIAETGE